VIVLGKEMRGQTMGDEGKKFLSGLAAANVSHADA
jgi:hypothetical protein